MPTTEYLASALGQSVLLDTAYTPPSAVYLALFTAAPDRTGGGTELAGGTYERKPLSFTEPGGDGVFYNAAVEFLDMPATTIVAVGVYDDETAGNLLYFYVDEDGVTLDAGDPYYVAMNTFVISH